MPKALKTERLILRPLTLADAPRVARFTGEWDVARMVSSVPHPQCEIMAEAWILLMQARAPLGLDHVFGIDLPGEVLIGCVGAHVREKPYAGRSVEIGYWIGKPFWNRGFASEAARAAARYAADLERGPVTARHFTDNPASGKVLKRAGFAYTGETIPLYCLARAARVPALTMERRLARVEAGAARERLSA